MSAVIEPPNVVDVPAIVIASSANLAIGISSLSISATITAANPSVTASASRVAAFIVPLELMFPLAVMLAVTLNESLMVTNAVSFERISGV